MSEILLEKLKTKMKIEPERVALSLENFIREYTEKLEREGVILGLSGGIDSAVIAALCARALGPGNRRRRSYIYKKFNSEIRTYAKNSCTLNRF